ncbi:FGGY-family carbohydrate kinase [Paraburkholderia tropica]|uniref:FGGY-family carbohydrate kinase n=1 Tax=Paraburkholderia tropica TaxID=92647 RepID=UPI0007EC93CC|nr:FGGY-family carbohydrate kinase [Paraburkholderia tropica]MBB2981661.1 D-ribulokinase [Paraburkholderia tropica]MBB3005147.1 D-ribulokinase [Paraburkholderia tropica]MBB6320679.1 D-ribulokinase [Paraburkholderia tropica]OBR47535.1 ribulokinase [Paraburkholderia tropica]
MTSDTLNAATRYAIGVDVGTGSARAGIFDPDGRMVASAKHDITVFHESGAIVEQSSGEIWNAVCRSVKDALAQANVEPAQIAGIGFDATCSLVVLGEGGRSLPVGPSDEAQRDIIVWMDHRAVEQAERINATNHAVLKFVGGKISPEMETPKLLWLREHRPAVFDAAWQFFDLTDFLTWRASGDLARSTCTVTCKWTYLAHEQRWDESYFRAVGLDVLADEGFVRIGERVVEPGTPLGQGLTAQAAAELGLRAGTPVAAGVIDAHAGGIGTVGADGAPESCLAYVFGTSSCTMTTTREPVFVPGVWGPYYSAMVPHTWLNEGGQSVAGAAIERLLAMHPLAPEMQRRAASEGQSLPVMLASLAAQQGGDLSGAIALADGLHVVPEFLGNRAPFADPHARAVIAGLGMETDRESLVALYIAGIASIGYGLRQIIEVQAAAGAAVDRVVISGGAGRLDLVRQLLADSTGKPVLVTQADEPVLLGAAMLGGVAGGLYGDVRTAMSAMSRIGATHAPSAGEIAALHDARYDAFRQLQGVARAIR